MANQSERELLVIDAIESIAQANHLAGRHDRWIPTFHTCKHYDCKKATSALEALQAQPSVISGSSLAPQPSVGVSSKNYRLASEERNSAEPAPTVAAKEIPAINDVTLQGKAEEKEWKSE